MDAANAAFFNAMAANGLEFDDTHQPTVIHPSAPVLPPLLALADRDGATGRDVLAAYVAGIDIACRIGNAVAPGHYARGWHITATCGTFGAAAASARLLGLTGEQAANALTVAASATGGIVESLPTAAKNLGVGNSARNGLMAALLAAAGFSGAPTAIEGKLGWAMASGDQPKIGEMVDDLGRRFELMRNTYKPYPCGVVLNAVIDATLALVAEGATPAAVVDVTVSGNALLLARADRPDVRNEKDAKISLQHCVAIALLFGSAGIGEFSPAVVADPKVEAMRWKVRALRDDTASPFSAKVQIRLGDGRSLERQVREPRGSVANPMTDLELEAKLRDLARYGESRVPVDDILAAVWNLDGAADVRVLTNLLAEPA